MSDAVISQLQIFPIKALDGVSLNEVTVLASGALQGDREFALVDERERYVNGKNYAQVHLIRAQFQLRDPHHRWVILNGPDMEEVKLSLDQDRSQIEAWCAKFLGFPLRLIQDTTTGFPDDLDACGPTVISTQTIATVSSWFEGISPEQMRARLRTNIEIFDVPAFWEDQLFGQPGTVVPVQIGEVTAHGVNPCQRCVVPTRDPQTAEATTGFQKIFTQARQESLPKSVDRSRFNHFYRLAVNTNIPATQAGKVIRVGDRVSVE